MDWWDGKAKRGDGCQVPGAGDQERAKKRVPGDGIGGVVDKWGGLKKQ